MDAFITSFHDLCNQLMPIFGAAVLVALLVLLIKIIKLVDDADVTLYKSHGTIDLVDKSIEKMQTPLDTVVKVSETVDKAHDATVAAVADAKEFVVKNVGEIKEKVSEIISSKDVEKLEELKEPSPEDIIEG